MHTIAEAAAALEGRERILVFTGAGISTESGIPDFRGPNGVWKKVDPKTFTLRHYMQNPDFRRERWQRWFGDDRPPWQANVAHRAIADLWSSGRMIGCITQNIDGLHVKGGLPETAIAEVHGNPRGIVCVEQGHPGDVEQVKQRWESGEADPLCECGSILKSTVVMFGENLPPVETSLAQKFSMSADAAIAVGSTISVYPAAEYLLSVADRSHPLVILNMGPTDADELATARLEGKAGDLLPQLVAALHAQTAG
ncbi:MAG: NAD-dependent deacetylase [Acidimicrobiia bacterium]|nr:NAD-dependent deacetylase [Acidimicrobiia bacterium]